MSIIKEWTAKLRSGEYAQCKNTLKNSVGFCCLGVATDMAIAAQAANGDWYDEGGPGGVWSFELNGGGREVSVLPGNVPNWLGLVHDNPSFTICFHDPDLRRVWNGYIEGYVWDSNGTISHESFIQVERQNFSVFYSLAELNDAGFTFDQIADIIDYFFEDGPVDRDIVDSRIARVSYKTLDFQELNK